MSYNNNQSFKATAPYRFVPLSKDIVSPHWADAVSHDIPFEDGVTGSIEVELTAHSDIFVSNGKQKEDVNEVLEFSNFDGKYFIPATSLKGMIRNVMEIISFGGMKRKVKNNKYPFAIRSISHPQYRNEVPQQSNDKIKICTGWLQKIGSEYKFKECLSGKIPLWNAKKASEEFQNFKQDDDKPYLFYPNLNGEYYGRIVKTGMMPGKKKEYVFFDEDVSNGESIFHLIKDFKNAYAYKNNESNVPEDAQKKFKGILEKLENGEQIPVWATRKNGIVQHFGLSTNYRLSSNIDIHDAIDNAQNDNSKPDLADTIFGYIIEKKQTQNSSEEESIMLKGRVNFSHAWGIVNTISPNSEKTVLLSTPSASYFPFYLQNKGTYLNSTAKASGWKRYPIRQHVKDYNSGNDPMKSIIKPLKEGVKFIFSINFHNLRKIELGALLSSLTLHNSEHLFHSIGMGKPLGMGKVKLGIKNLVFNNIQPDDSIKYMKMFECYMTTKSQTVNWISSKAMKEFFSMCEPQKDSMLEYMNMEGLGRTRNKPHQLQNYSQKESNLPVSLIDENKISSFQKWLKEDEEKLKFAGSLDVAIAKFKKDEENKLEAAFNQKKQELIGLIKANRVAQKEAERLAREEQFKQQQQAKIAIVQSQSLEGFIGDKKTKKINDLKNLVEQYGSKKYECKRNELSTKFTEGYLTEKTDIEFIEQWLSNSFQNGGNSIKKQFTKPFGPKHPIFKEIIKWLGSEKAQQLYNQLNQS